VLLERAGLPLDGPAWPGAPHSLADELLVPSVIYAPAVLEVLRAVDVHGIAHITGGGIPGNLARVLPAGCDALVRRGSWETPRVFAEIQRLGAIDDAEMARVFNLGVGMVLVVTPGDAPVALDRLRARGHAAVVIGEVVAGGGRVRFA
jgi:phosphoribosylformylglycinamidine cyclo-ligase